MHLLIPFAAALSEPAVLTLRELALPNLSRLLASWQPAIPDTREAADEFSLSPPHERALAAAWGWPVQTLGDGCLPWAAHAAAADGLAGAAGSDAPDTPDTRAWGLLTPVHWHVGREQISLADPAALDLSDAESRVFFDAIRHLFESEGWALTYAAAGRWYVLNDALHGLPCASLDRVIGRNIDVWLTASPKTRLLRRLQNEVQMLLYTHPLNDERIARGALPMNSFWVSGCGRRLPVAAGAAASVKVDARLREPLLADDWADWAEAWRALDAEALPALLRRAERGEPAALTLCGERSAQRFDAVPRSLWHKLGARFKTADAAAMLEAL